MFSTSKTHFFLIIGLAFGQLAQADDNQVGRQYISSQKAISIAQSKIENAWVKEVELKHGPNGAYYEVDLESRQYEYEIHVDAKTGQIRHTHKELND